MRLNQFVKMYEIPLVDCDHDEVIAHGKGSSPVSFQDRWRKPVRSRPLSMPGRSPMPDDWLFEGTYTNFDDRGSMKTKDLRDHSTNNTRDLAITRGAHLTVNSREFTRIVLSSLHMP
jgi:hypothetical protein